MDLSLYPYLIAIVVAWLTSHVLKYVIAVVRDRNFKHFKKFYSSGGMPSAHSATTVALAVIIGAINGIDTAIFALAALFAGVVMYDAFTVRRSSGEQGVALRGYLARDKTSKVILPRVALGHTPVEVLAGASLGVVIALVVFFATR